MANTKVDFNAQGHFVQSAEVAIEDTITVGEAGGLIAGSVVSGKAADSKGYLMDGTEPYASAILGISDGTYAQNATANYFSSGDVATGMPAMTAESEYFAKHDGTLALYSALTSGKYTRSMGVAKSTTTLQVIIGPVQLVP